MAAVVSRRTLLVASAVLPWAAACAPRPAPAPNGGPVTDSADFVLVHGAWHSSAHWARVTAALFARGHGVLPLDLPGHGVEARFPAAYLAGDHEALRTERSPVADVTLDVAADTVVAALRTLRARPVRRRTGTPGATNLIMVREIP